MPDHHNRIYDAPSNEQINNRLKKDSDKVKETMKYHTKGVQDQPHHSVPNDGISKDSILTGSSFTKDFTDIMESLNDLWDVFQEMELEVINAEDTIDVEDDIPDAPSMGNVGVVNPPVNQEELFAKLNKIFTPILIMSDAEDEASSSIKESFNKAGLLTERNTIKFDSRARLDQLVSICAILLQQAKNTPEYQAYVKGHKLRKRAKLRMQEIEGQNARDLAQKFLVNVSSVNPSEAARRAATNLLPETQH